MATIDKELASKLARRRSFGEQVYEREAGTSSADTSAKGATICADASTAPECDTVAFEEALQKIRAFEMAGISGRGTRSVRPKTLNANHDKEEETPQDIQPPLASPSGDGADTMDSPAVTEPARREDLKSSVRERYFALLNQGVPPNAAAARAILEASGQHCTGPAENSEAPVLSASSSTDSPRSAGTPRRTCASSATARDKVRKKKAIVVAS